MPLHPRHPIPAPWGVMTSLRQRPHRTGTRRVTLERAPRPRRPVIRAATGTLGFGLLALLWLAAARAELNIEITQGEVGAAPIAVVPFAWHGQGRPPLDPAAVIAADLARSGRFHPLPVTEMLDQPHTASQVDFRAWKALGQDALVVGSVRPKAGGLFEIRYQLFDVLKGALLTGERFTSGPQRLRLTAHHIADRVFERLTGIPGAFTTRIAYIGERRDARGRHLRLYVADADGHGRRAIVRSDRPLLSPAWSPDGRRIAYVSFEDSGSSVYVQWIADGRRRQVAAWPGINSAPAWSPDGRRLALSLSKDGNPEIYILDLASRRLTRLTHNFAIDTEPTWSPDGRTIVFTSSRGGGAQLYRIPVSGGEPRRLTFENDYNAAPEYSPDGRFLTLVTRERGHYRIALLEPATGLFQVLTRGELDESPHFAPNGAMIIYATRSAGRGVLATVSTDGRFSQKLVADEGDVREPAWGPAPRIPSPSEPTP